MSREQEITFGIHNKMGSVSGTVVAYYSPCIDHDTGEMFGQLNWWKAAEPFTVFSNGVITRVEPAYLPPEILEELLWIINSSLN